VEIVHHRAQNVLQVLEVQQQAGVVQGLAAEGDANPVVVSMGLLALAVIVAQVMSRGKGVFYSDFEHGLPTPVERKSGVRWGPRFLHPISRKSGANWGPRFRPERRK